MDLGKRSYSRFNQFQHNIAAAKPTSGAAAPARAISTSAKTGWCTGARSSAAIRAFLLLQYTRGRILRREYNTEKSCAPLCTVSCSQQVAMLDNWRAPQTLQPASGGAACRSRAARATDGRERPSGRIAGRATAFQPFTTGSYAPSDFDVAGATPSRTAMSGCPTTITTEVAALEHCTSPALTTP